MQQAAEAKGDKEAAYYRERLRVVVAGGGESICVHFEYRLCKC